MRIARSVQALLLALVLLATAGSSFAGVFVSVNFAPPALPVYTQPLCPAPGYAWTPGYWAWGPEGYYWVPGTWVVAPAGLLWTPGYWGFGNGAYLWNEGYWGPRVGFYGGINYGFGYTGVGFYGGYWRGRSFYYNRSVTNVNTRVVRNIYTKTVVRNVNVNRVSFNGGNGGIHARPTASEERAVRENHTAPLAMQQDHERAAGKDRSLLASTNHGRPEVAATAKPGEFNGRDTVAASRAGAPYKPAAAREAASQPNGRGERNVPRPPATARSESSPERREGNMSNRAVRPATETRNTEAGNTGTRNTKAQNTEAHNRAVPRPGSASSDNAPRHENPARSESSTHRESAPKPVNNARRENQPAPKPAPRPENKSRPATPSRPAPSYPDKAPQQQKAPRPENNAPASHGPDRPQQDRPHAGRSH